MKAPAVYTLEASLCGAAVGSTMPHFTSNDLQNIGKIFCQAIILYQDVQIDPSLQLKQTILSHYSRAEILAEFVREYGNDQRNKQHEVDIMSSASGSDSDPGEDDLDGQEFQQIIPIE